MALSGFEAWPCLGHSTLYSRGINGSRRAVGETQRNAKERGGGGAGWGDNLRETASHLGLPLTDTEDKRLIYEPHRIPLRITERTCKDGDITQYGF